MSIQDVWLMTNEIIHHTVLETILECGTIQSD